MDIGMIQFDANGLVPAIVQDCRTGRVLMLAYMNRESLEITMREGRTCFYSRSRRTLWRKGETSGNTQRVVSIEADCDQDALLVKVARDGPACHTGADSCFETPVFEAPEAAGEAGFSLDALYNLIRERKTTPREGSYTSYLFDKGLDKMLKKVGEEAAEVIVAAKNNDPEELTFELADLCYHALVLMAGEGLTVDDVKRELARRHVVDKKVKQEKLQ